MLDAEEILEALRKLVLLAALLAACGGLAVGATFTCCLLREWFCPPTPTQLINLDDTPYTGPEQ